MLQVNVGGAKQVSFQLLVYRKEDEIASSSHDLCRKVLGNTQLALELQPLILILTVLEASGFQDLRSDNLVNVQLQVFFGTYFVCANTLRKTSFTPDEPAFVAVHDPLFVAEFNRKKLRLLDLTGSLLTENSISGE